MVEKEPSPKKKEEWQCIGDTIRIPVTARCNQRCIFCHFISDEYDSAFKSDALKTAIKTISTDRVRLITFTGGEPTIVPALPEYIRIVRGLGIPEIEIETNGLMFSYRDYAKRLKGAGLTGVVISLPHILPEAYDAITSYEGGLALAMKGIENAVAEGLRTTVRFVLTPALVSNTTALASFIREQLRGVAKVELVFPESHGSVEEDNLDFHELGKTLRMLKFNEKVGGIRIPITFSRLWGLPPCVFSDSEFFSGVFALETGAVAPGYEKVTECNTCVLGMCCAGLPASLKKKPNPITVNSSYAAFRAGSEVEYKSIANFCTFNIAEGLDRKPTVHDALLRINYHCNQRCKFCWIEPGYTNLPHDTVEEKITELGKMGLKMLAITGGEPTLNNHLVEYVRLAKQTGIKEITLQTNAVRLADVEMCRLLKEAGLDSVFVSFHAHTAEISDSITGAPGTFEKTLRGISNLMDCDIFFTLSFVINALNYKIIPEYVEFVSTRIRGAPIIFSFVAPLYDALMHKGIIPRFSDIKPYLKRGIEICLERRIPYFGLSGMCGIPPCMLDGDMRCFPDIQRVVSQGGEFDFIKSPDCINCSFDDYCFGVRRQYAELYGLDEVHSVKVPSVKVTIDHSETTPAEFLKKVLSR